MTGVSPTRVIGGRYTVLGEFGRGRTGTVWRAEDRVMDREVAVEELPLPGGQAPDERRMIRERLLRAARAAGRIDHPGLLTVHDVVTDGDVDHLVMELVHAPTLAERVATDGPLDEPAATALARQLSAALQAVHHAGVVHGDVSPDTVVLGPDGRAVLADLGVAEAVDPARVMRAPDFLAPELLDGGPATPESDVWGLGATLCFAVHGEPPFAGSSREETARAVRGAELPHRVSAGPIGRVLVDLLQRAPHERPTTRQLAARLTAPESSGGATGAAAPAARVRWTVAAALVALLVGLGGGFALAGAGAAHVTTLTRGAGGDVRTTADLAGACLRGGLDADAPGEVDRVNCVEAHALEVFATLDPFGRPDQPYPGRDVLTRFAASACTAAFEAVVPVPDGLEIVALVPSEAAFATGASPERAVHCLLRAADGSALRGSRTAAEPG